MIFPAPRTLRAGLIAALCPLLAGGGLILGSAIASADDDPVPGPPLHHVQYTVFSETPFRNADIYYRDTDPANWADYSHDPYVFSPKVEADIGPEQRWSMDVMLANPDQWAMVTAGIGDAPQRPNFHCIIAVDGQVVSTSQGPKGALCSIRNW